jgi:uncharacterized SAM-binding protein YcdF (DUF218 family)
MLAGVARWIGFLTMAAGATAVVLLAGGFGWFVSHIAGDEVSLDTKADAIVALTGAAARIPDAIELLATERGKRLLITGVHRATSAREIARLTPLYSRYFTCCIDLDRSALNTFGNALEAKRWAREHNFNSLIVVTSNWHMPRAMAELQHQLPDVQLIPYPVISEKAKAEPWWSNVDSARLLFLEYLKYLLACTRMRIDPDGAI